MQRSFWLALFATSSTAVAAEPIFTHQGRMLDPSGNPVEGSQSLRVAFFPSAGASTALWDKTFTNVAFADGFFTVHLQGNDTFATPLSTVFAQEPQPTVYLGVALGTALPDPPYAPITQAPVAQRADLADHATVLSSASDTGVAAGEVQWAGSDILVRSFDFSKRRDDSQILAFWYDNLRCYGDSVACKWEVRFRPASGGTAASCTSPGAIVADWYNADDEAGSQPLNLHLPTTVVSTCAAYGGNAFTAGDYVAEIWVLEHPHSAAEGLAWTGWSETVAQFIVLEVD